MARSNPHHDWDDASGPSEHRSNGSEWESLRNELVALLDQVEDQVAGTQSAPAPRPAQVQPAPQPEPQGTRHTAALRSVREAVDRLAERSEPEPVARRSSVANAVSQIRARQTGSAKPQPEPMQGSTAVELAGFAQAVASLGQRIEHFEAKVSAQIDALDKGDISAQVAQLSDVIELLASAVGESGQVKRIEAQISNLADMVANGTGRAQDETSARIEELTATIEKLVNHQVQTSGRDEQLAAEASERQALAMEQIEHSVRNIYDRIDALEHSQPDASGDIERISRDMAALTQAVQNQGEPQTLLARIDALNDRIGSLEPGASGEAETLRDSISVLRNVVVEALEPRFSALESRMDAMSPAPSSEAGSELEAQLRKIVQRVEETSAQLSSLAESYNRPDEDSPQPDLDTLATKIVERTRAGLEDGVPMGTVEKADLEELEKRLAALFAADRTSPEPASEHLTGVKDSIAQVDNRIARLESMLNEQTRTIAPRVKEDTPATGEDATPAAPKGRSKPADEMPKDPASGEQRKVLGDNPAHVAGAFAGLEPETRDDKPFKIDPEAVEKPAKPQSSFAMDQESPFGGRFRDVPAEEAGDKPSANRSSFIEAARRSARQHSDTVESTESKSLIGRAMARFQRNSAQDEDIAQAETAETGVPVLERGQQQEPQLPAEDIDTSAERGDLVAEDNEGEDAVRPGFITRNRRALLLGTAVIVVAMLTIPLVVNRLGGSAPQQNAAVPAAVEVPAAAPSDAPDASEDAPAEPQAEPETTSDASDLTSGVRMIDQQPTLSAARVDASSLSAGQTIDPVTTAAIGPQPDRHIERISTPAASTDLASSLPPISVPEEIEPAALRQAAEEGDANAQFEVGAILTEGHVVEQDLAAAAQWYERSAAQGFAPAQYRLGSLYESGRGVEKSLAEAEVWYERAAEQGNRMSMHNLASLHAGGELETQDFASAAKWFEEAAARGLTDSQFNLGMLYARGLGVEQDFETSYVWFSLAARSGDEDAVDSRDDVARSLDAETVQRLNEQVTGWQPAQIDMAANFAPIGTWDEEFDPGPGIDNSDVILQVQMLLNKLGYEVGTPDGIAGPKTREAIAAFERETGMNESGAVNPRLLAVLGSQPV